MIPDEENGVASPHVMRSHRNLHCLYIDSGDVGPRVTLSSIEPDVYRHSRPRRVHWTVWTQRRLFAVRLGVLPPCGALSTTDIRFRALRHVVVVSRHSLSSACSQS